MHASDPNVHSSRDQEDVHALRGMRDYFPREYLDRCAILSHPRGNRQFYSLYQNATGWVDNMLEWRDCIFGRARAPNT